MKKGGALPKGLMFGVYLIVGIAAIFFIISLIFGTMKAKETALTSLGLKISASSDSGSCKSGEVLYGINNYPYLSTPTQSGSHSRYTDKMPSGTWKCSAICGPSDTEKFTKEFLPTLKSQNKELNIVGDKNAFDALIARITSKDEILDRTVILQSSLNRKGKGCFGPSEDYKNLTGATVTKENTTASDQKKAQEERKKKLAEEAKKREAQEKKTSSSSGSGVTSNTAAGSPEEQALQAPTTGSAGSLTNISDEGDVTDGEKDKVSLVGPCWLEFNKVAVDHMKNHLDKYDLYGDEKMRKERIIRDIKTELGGGWVYLADNKVRTVPEGDERKQEWNLKQIDGLHDADGKKLAKQIGEYYGEYREYALNDEISKDPKKEEKMLKQCEEVKERVKKANTSFRGDIRDSDNKGPFSNYIDMRREVLELHKSITDARLNTNLDTEKMNELLSNIKKNNNFQYDDAVKQSGKAKISSYTFFAHLKEYPGKTAGISPLAKDRYRGFWGIYTIQQDNHYLNALREELKRIIKATPQINNANTKTTVTISGNIAIADKHITKEGKVKNSTKYPIHICAFLIDKDGDFNESAGCHKVETKRQDGGFYVQFKVDNKTLDRILNNRADKVFKIYAAYGLQGLVSILHGRTETTRNYYGSFPTKLNIRENEVITLQKNNKGEVLIKIKKPIILYGDKHMVDFALYVLSPFYNSSENMILQTSSLFQREAKSKNCLKLESKLKFSGDNNTSLGKMTTVK